MPDHDLKISNIIKKCFDNKTKVTYDMRIDRNHWFLTTCVFTFDKEVFLTDFKNVSNVVSRDLYSNLNQIGVQTREMIW